MPEAVPVSQERALPRRRAHWILFVLLAAGVAALDLWSKYYLFQLLGAKIEEVGGAADRRMAVIAQQPINVIPGYFQFEANINYGAFSGWFSSHTFYLTLLSLAALGVIVWFLSTNLRGERAPSLWFTAALGLLWGGTLGNLYDRAFFGYVRDFVKWYIVIDGRSHVWPNFNVADSAICVGVGLMLIDSLLARRELRT